MFTKPKVAMLVAEFLGTALLTITVLAVSMSQMGYDYFVALGVGLALLIGVLMFGNVSGAVFNPAITIGLWSVRKLQSVQAFLYILVQLLGGITAYLLFLYLSGIGDELSKRTVNYSTSIMVAEVVGTAIFAMGVAAAVYQKMTGGLKASVIGGSLAVGVLIASAAATAGYLNPAVALGAQAWEWGNFVLGPILGAVIGFNLYSLLFAVSEKPAAVKAAATTANPARKTAKKPARKK